VFGSAAAGRASSARAIVAITGLEVLNLAEEFKPLATVAARFSVSGVARGRKPPRQLGNLCHLAAMGAL